MAIIGISLGHTPEIPEDGLLEGACSSTIIFDFSGNPPSNPKPGNPGPQPRMQLPTWLHQCLTRRNATSNVQHGPWAHQVETSEGGNGQSS